MRSPVGKLLRPELTLGFTLAELLVSLAILGVIATFTIPKILSAQQNTTYKARAKEAASILTGALQAYQQNNILSGSTTAGAITPYINYATRVTSGTVDGEYSNGTITCSVAFWQCLQLHNGAMLIYLPVISFGGTNTTNAVYYLVDPDGVNTDNTTNGPGKSVQFLLYTNGKITDLGNATPNTGFTDSGVPRTTGPTPAWTPPWFSWN